MSTKRTWLGVAVGMVSLAPMGAHAAGKGDGAPLAVTAPAATAAEPIGADARLEPVMKDEHQQLGYRVLEVKPGTPFAMLGLQKGDLLRSIDGRDLRSTQDLDIAYHEVSGRHDMKVVVDLVREGHEIVFVYSVP